MKKLLFLGMILCLGQPLYLIAMEERVTTEGTPTVHILAIVDENWKPLSGPITTRVIYPNPSNTNIGLIHMARACHFGIQVYKSFSYTGKELYPPISTFALGGRGIFSFWLDDRGFWCNNETRHLVEAEDIDGHIIKDKQGNAKLKIAPNTDLKLLIPPLQPNAHYWITIRITKNDVGAWIDQPC